MRETRVCCLETCDILFICIPSSKKKYCSRSCSTINSNRVSPRRVKTKVCSNKDCIKLIRTVQKYCSTLCRTLDIDILNKNISEIQASAKYQISARLRGVAREQYKESDEEYSCYICGYSIHVDICHIKDIFQFSPNNTVKETCEIGNLIALCKTHHWEFDHGYIEIRGVLKPLRPSQNKR